MWENFFYFMNFILNLHILVTRGKKKWNYTIFGHILAIFEGFLNEKKKMKKNKKAASCLRECWETFLFYDFYS